MDCHHHQMERLEAENAALRARVAQLEAENARLRQENSAHRATTTMTIPRTEAGRRLGSVVSAVSTGAAVAVAEVDLDEDMPFANGKEVDLTLDEPDVAEISLESRAPPASPDDKIFDREVSV